MALEQKTSQKTQLKHLINFNKICKIVPKEYEQIFGDGEGGRCLEQGTALCVNLSIPIFKPQQTQEFGEKHIFNQA